MNVGEAGDSTARLLQEAARRSIRYRGDMSSRSVAPLPEKVDRLVALDGPMPDEPLTAVEVLRVLDEVGSPATMAMAGPRFFGFVVGGSMPVTLAANWLAGAWDQNSALYNVTPATARIEQIALSWLIQLLELPPDCGGGFVTGATVANFCALAAARHAVLAQHGWNVEADGLFGAPEVTVVVGEEAHTTLFKSLGLLGFGRNRVTKVPADSQGRFRADCLPEISGPTIVCLQAGNVNTGAFDPFLEVVEKAHASGAWVHVDGAFGLWASALPNKNALANGIALADSWATDAHKWLNVPYDSGLVFVHNADALRAAMAVTAEYLPTDSPHRNPSDFTPELSRRARGVEVWAALKALGRQGVVERMERSCRQAVRFAEALRHGGYEVLNDVMLNQVLVSFGSPERTRQVISAIQADGTCWCGGTVWQGRTAMRISVCSFETSDSDVERSVEAMLRIAKNFG